MFGAWKSVASRQKGAIDGRRLTRVVGNMNELNVFVVTEKQLCVGEKG